MNIVQALREAAEFYSKDRPRASLCTLETEIGQNECEGISRRMTDAANEIERYQRREKFGWQNDSGGEMVTCAPAPHAAAGAPILGKTYKL